MVDGGTANKDIQRAKGLGVYTTHYLSNEKRTPTGATATSEAKTVKDHQSAESEATHQEALSKKTSVCVGVGYSQH